MKFLANENIPLASVRFLKAQGFDVLSIGLENPSVADAEVMQLAMRQARTILTFDRDYGELIFKHNYKPKEGVVYLRLKSYAPEEPGKIVFDLLKNGELSFQNALTVVDEFGIRQRKY